MELQAGELKIEFVKVGDRFTHKLLLCRDGVCSVVLDSIEGTHEERWPESPPLQQIVAEAIGRDGCMVLLGVGLSGTGHWSISVDENEAGGLVLDIACRVSGEHGFLGSTWRLADGWHPISSIQPNDVNRPSGFNRIAIGSEKHKQSIELIALHGNLDLYVSSEARGDFGTGDHFSGDSQGQGVSAISEFTQSSLGDSVADGGTARIVSRPNGRDVYPKPHRWAVQCKLIAE